MFSQGPRLQIEEREEGIVQGFSGIEIVTSLPIFCFGEESFPLILIGIKSIIPVRKDDDHFLKRMKRIVQIPLRMKVMGNDRLGNLLWSIISFSKTSMLRKFLKPHLQGILQVSISPIPTIHHCIGDEGNIFMKKPMIFLLFFLTKQLLCSLRRMDFPPNSCSMKVIPMEKKKDGIFGRRILKKIFWQNDEEPFLLI
jgi:hypothetical protein